MSAPPLIGVAGGESEAKKFLAAAQKCGIATRLRGPSQSPEDFTAGLSAVVMDGFAALSLARELSRYVPVVPNLHALEAAQDRLIERQLFKSLGVLCPPFAGVESVAGVEAAVAKFGLPVTLLSRRKTGPGRGQSKRLTKSDELRAAFEAIDKPGIIDAGAAFQTIVHLSGVRTGDGKLEYWPPVEGDLLKIHLDRLPLDVLRHARTLASTIAQALKLVGVFRIKFLQTEGHLLAEELLVGLSDQIHDVIDSIQLQGMFANQYENHLLASAGMPLRPCGLGADN